MLEPNNSTMNSAKIAIRPEFRGELFEYLILIKLKRWNFYGDIQLIRNKGLFGFIGGLECMCLCVGLESKIRSCVNYSVLGKEEVDSTQPKGIAAQVLSYSVGRQVLMVSISYKNTF